jgi:hypothetical protein
MRFREYKPWSEREIELLRAMWDGPEKLSTDAMGDRLGRTKRSIIGKAYRLRLTRKQNPASRGEQRFSRRALDGRSARPLPRGASTLPPMQSELRR